MKIFFKSRKTRAKFRCLSSRENLPGTYSLTGFLKVIDGNSHCWNPAGDETSSFSFFDTCSHPNHCQMVLEVISHPVSETFLPCSQIAAACTDAQYMKNIAFGTPISLKIGAVRRCTTTTDSPTKTIVSRLLMVQRTFLCLAGRGRARKSRQLLLVLSSFSAITVHCRNTVWNRLMCQQVCMSLITKSACLTPVPIWQCESVLVMRLRGSVPQNGCTRIQTLAPTADLFLYLSV